MEKCSLPLWIFPAMKKAGFCDTDRGTLLRLLVDYVATGKEPNEMLYPEVEAGFWFVVAAMQSEEEAEQ